MPTWTLNLFCTQLTLTLQRCTRYKYVTYVPLNKHSPTHMLHSTPQCVPTLTIYTARKKLNNLLCYNKKKNETIKHKPNQSPSLMSTCAGVDIAVKFCLIFAHPSVHQINSSAASAPRPCKNWRISTTRPISWASALSRSTTRHWPMNTIWAICRYWSTIAIRHQLFMKV